MATSMRCRSILPFAVVAAVLAASHVRAADPEPADDDPREAAYPLAPVADGYTTATHALDLVAGAYTLPLFVDPEPAALRVARKPAPVVAATRLHKDRKLVLGVGASTGVLFYGGIGVLLGGQRIESRAEEKQTDLLTELGADPERPDAASLAALEQRYPTADLHARLRRGSDLQAAGTTVGMIGAGMIFGLLPHILEARPRAAYTVLGIGGAAIVGGSAWMADYRRRQDDVLGRTDLAHRTTDDGLAGHRIGASMFVGLGVGMVVTSTATLLVDRARRRRPLAAVPLAAPGLAGLIVRGAF